MVVGLAHPFVNEIPCCASASVTAELVPIDTPNNITRSAPIPKNTRLRRITPPLGLAPRRGWSPRPDRPSLSSLADGYKSLVFNAEKSSSRGRSARRLLLSRGHGLREAL